MRTPLIAGNWKMHKTLAEARELVTGIRAGAESVHSVDVLICPPYHLLFPMAKAIAGSRIKLGAQNAYHEPQGAFTGEISVPMLQDAGCSHVIIGHSERRHVFGEGNELLAKKVRAVVKSGLTAVYCVGETLAEREALQTHQVVQQQLNAVLSKEVPPDCLVVAYEPVWAIGTGKNASPEQAQEVHAMIRSRLAAIFDPTAAARIQILYGGSVKPSNAKGILDQSDIDGALVGGACLVATDFVSIIQAAV